MIFFKRFMSSVETNRLGAECHRQGREGRNYYEMNLHIVVFCYLMGFVDSYKNSLIFNVLIYYLLFYMLSITPPFLPSILDISTGDIVIFILIYFCCRVLTLGRSVNLKLRMLVVCLLKMMEPLLRFVKCQM